MEELLNKLIEKGWKVYHRNYNKCVNVWRNCAYFMYRDEYGRPMSDKSFSLRELVAKESGLWQFCTENELITLKFGDRRHYNTDNDRDKICLDCNYPYWLIESALCDEDKLEQFLLDNIKIDE